MSTDLMDRTTKPQSTTDPLERNFSRNSGEETRTVVVPRIINQTRRTSSSTAPIHQDNNTRRTRNKWPSRICPRNIFVRLEPLVKETRKQANFDAPPKERTDLDQKLTARDELDFDKMDDNEDESVFGRPLPRPKDPRNRPQSCHYQHQQYCRWGNAKTELGIPLVHKRKAPLDPAAEAIANQPPPRTNRLWMLFASHTTIPTPP